MTRPRYAVLFLAAVLCAAVVRSRPSTPAAAETHAGAVTPPRVSAPGVHVYADRARGELVVESRAVDVGARSGHAQVLPVQAASPVGGWLHGYSVELVDARGRVVPRAMLHHVIVVVPNRRGLFNPIMLRIVAAGHETPEVRLPSMVGYRLRPGDPLLIAGMLDNESASAYRGVRIRVRMPMKSADAWIRPIGIVPFSMDVMPTGTQRAWDLPPGRTQRSWEGSPAVAGRILGIGGHLHRYGVALLLQDATTGQTLWHGRPVRNAAGEVLSMPTRTFLRGVAVRPDHRYRLTAMYENPTGRTIPGGGMGAAGGAFIPADPARWPAIDPRSQEYQLDLRANSTDPAVQARGMHGAHGAHGNHH